MKYVLIGIACYIVFLIIAAIFLIINKDTSRLRVSDIEYKEFINDLKKQEQKKLNKKNKKK